MAKSGLDQKVEITSEALVEIVGKNVASRKDIVKKIWIYIKGHGLQDGRDILASDDELLSEIFEGVKNKSGKKVMKANGHVEMFGVASAISVHTQSVE